MFAAATPAQRDRVEVILRAAFTPYVRKLGRELTADAYAWLDGAIADGHVFLAVTGEEIVGAVATSRSSADLVIEQVAVRPDRQGEGIGSWLIETVERRAREDGLSALELDTAEIMQDLLRLYRRHGFELVRSAPPAHGNDAHLRVLMRKPL